MTQTNADDRRWADDPLTDEVLAAAVDALADQPPARDLWPGIEARIARGRGARVVSLTWPQLAMAATLLMSVSAGVSWLALQPREERDGAEPAILAVAEPSEAVRSDVAPATFAEAAFDAAVADLQRIVRDERDRLDPQTVMVLERNLRVIDEAIQQARAALDADPANTYLNSHLADARRRKLDLLRRAAALTSGT